MKEEQEMTKAMMVTEINKIQKELGLYVWPYEEAMKNTKAFLENKLEYLLKASRKKNSIE